MFIAAKIGKAAPGFLLLLAVVWTGGQPLLSQTVGTPNTVEEKYPTPRDPTYTAPMIPPYLRSTQTNSAAELLLNPEGVQEQSQEYPDAAERLREEIQTSNELENKGDRIYLENQYLQQYGMDSYDFRLPYSESYSEDGWRRAQIVFFLSLPITAGITYGTMSGIKQSQGESNRFTGPQTALLAGLSVLFSSAIAWYDHSNWIEWKEKQKDLSFLMPTEMQRKRLEALPSMRRSFWHPLALPDAATENARHSFAIGDDFAPVRTGYSASVGLGHTWRY